jgi:hypothetical protein
MANQRQLLLHSIATTIADYRQGEIPAIDANHVDRWVRQFGKFGFNDEAQVIILNEMERILNTYYISYKKAQAFISKVLTSQNLFGANPAEAIINFQFLQIQTRGSSQNDLLSLCDSTLQTTYELGIEDCGTNPVAWLSR